MDRVERWVMKHQILTVGLIFILGALWIGILAVSVQGCAKVQPGFCALVQAGLAYVDGQIQSGSEPDAQEFQERIAPVLAAKGMSDLLDQAKEIWDSIPTEQKLKAAKQVLEYLDGAYCKTGGEPGKAADPTAEAEVLHILLEYTKAR